MGDPTAWTLALAGELRALAEEGRFALAPKLDTIYVGGGTPSLLGPESMAALAELIGLERTRAPGVEWTAEANPESFTTEVAAGWYAAGVNRLSLGVQSFHEPTLAWMGRMHGAEGSRAAVATARAVGIDDVSIDLIFALPDGAASDGGGRSWDADLDETLALEPSHISLYGLTVESGTPLARGVAEGRIATASEERYRDEYLRACERLTSAGYVHYEVSNFAMPGNESRHNRVYWEGGAYLGLGNGAHSFSEPLRRWNVRAWDEYARVTGAGRLPVAGEETVSPDAARLERIWLGLRTDRGLPWGDLAASADDLAARWVRHGWARREAQSGDERVRLTAEGWLLLDGLSVELEGTLAGRHGITPEQEDGVRGIHDP